MLWDKRILSLFLFLGAQALHACVDTAALATTPAETMVAGLIENHATLEHEALTLWRNQPHIVENFGSFFYSRYSGRSFSAHANELLQWARIRDSGKKLSTSQERLLEILPYATLAHALYLATQVPGATPTNIITAASQIADLYKIKSGEKYPLQLPITKTLLHLIDQTTRLYPDRTKIAGTFAMLERDITGLTQRASIILPEQKIAQALTSIDALKLTAVPRSWRALFWQTTAACAGAYFLRHKIVNGAQYLLDSITDYVADRAANEIQTRVKKELAAVNYQELDAMIQGFMTRNKEAVSHTVSQVLFEKPVRPQLPLDEANLPPLLKEYQQPRANEAPEVTQRRKATVQELMRLAPIHRLEEEFKILLAEKIGPEIQKRIGGAVPFGNTGNS